MPSLDDRICDSLLGKKVGLDRKLKATNHASSILNSIIQFIPAKRLYEDESRELKAKYARLRSSKSGSRWIEATPSCPSTSSLTVSIDTNVVGAKLTVAAADMPPPLLDIFPADRVKLNWDAKLKRSTAVGLHNLGNTCFLNSVLQILSNTAPLANYLLSNEHDNNRCPGATGFCGLCLMRNHIQRVFTCSNGNALSPSAVVNRVRCFMKSYSMGRQEDAHEFLRYFIDSMQTAALYAHKGKRLDLHTKETSVIGRIFGGYLKNDVTCNRCRFSSITYDPFLDISVEVKQLHSLEAALAHFTRPETLANQNAYKCPKCKVKVSARKMFTIHQAPNILTIQLKRFDHMGKIDRYIPYPERLSLRPYMTEKQGQPVIYKLYGVVVHHGRSTRSGHYYSFARNPCDQWHQLDDSRASPASVNAALKCSGAYLLFYIRAPTPVAAVKPQVNSSPQMRIVQAGRNADSPIKQGHNTNGVESGTVKPRNAFSPVLRADCSGNGYQQPRAPASHNVSCTNAGNEASDNKCSNGRGECAQQNGSRNKLSNGGCGLVRPLQPPHIGADAEDKVGGPQPESVNGPKPEKASVEMELKRKEKRLARKKEKKRSTLAAHTDALEKVKKKKKKRERRKRENGMCAPTASHEPPSTGEGASAERDNRQSQERRVEGSDSGRVQNGVESDGRSNDPPIHRQYHVCDHSLADRVSAGKEFNTVDKRPGEKGRKLNSMRTKLKRLKKRKHFQMRDLRIWLTTRASQWSFLPTRQLLMSGEIRDALLGCGCYDWGRLALLGACIIIKRAITRKYHALLNCSVGEENSPRTNGDLTADGKDQRTAEQTRSSNGKRAIGRSWLEKRKRRSLQQDASFGPVGKIRKYSMTAIEDV